MTGIKKRYFLLQPYRPANREIFHDSMMGTKKNPDKKRQGMIAVNLYPLNPW
jgi:hypothetical protein